MTEDEAKTKWCPQSRYVYGFGDHPQNRWKQEGGEALNPLACRCIASECMMWRWWSEDKGTGYCGLAGELAGKI